MIVINSQVRVSYLGPAQSTSEMQLLRERRVGRGRLGKRGAFWVDKQIGEPKDGAQRGATPGSRALENEKRQHVLLIPIESTCAKNSRVEIVRIQWGSVEHAFQRKLEESPRWEERVFWVERMAWDVTAHFSFIPGTFFFSPLGGSRCSCKRVHFSVRLTWIPGLENTVDVVTDIQEALGRERWRRHALELSLSGRQRHRPSRAMWWTFS